MENPYQYIDTQGNDKNISPKVRAAPITNHESLFNQMENQIKGKEIFIICFLAALTVLGFYVFWRGGELISVLRSFY